EPRREFVDLTRYPRREHDEPGVEGRFFEIGYAVQVRVHVVTPRHHLPGLYRLPRLIGIPEGNGPETVKEEGIGERENYECPHGKPGIYMPPRDIFQVIFVRTGGPASRRTDGK